MSKNDFDEYEEEVIEDEEFEEKEEATGLAGVFQRNAPIFAISAAFHFLVLFIISLIPTTQIAEEEVKMVITDIVEVEEVEEIEEIEEIEVEEVEVEVETETETEEVTESETEIEETLESETDAESEEAEVISEAPPADVAGEMMMMGISGGGAAGGGGGMPKGYGNRAGGGKKAANGKYGGDKKTMNAVDRALKWLAEHQDKDGSWDFAKYEGHEGHGAERTAITAGAILPFLGAGHSERVGNYKKTVKSGIKYINQQIAAKGTHFGRNYGSALILMALAEASIFGSSSTTEMNANKVAEMFINGYLQKNMGWGYGGGGTDLSVSGWVALGLKSAKAAELPAMKSEKGKEVWVKYKEWIGGSATCETSGFGEYHGRAVGTGKGTPHMTWVGMFQRQILDFPSDDMFLAKASEHTLGWVKGGKWVGTEKMGSIYGIYYGTLSAFQQQGKLWKTWNAGMKKTLIPNQREGSTKELGGSWNPTIDSTGKYGGRVLTTALAALCLEVYYRYDIMH